VILASEGKVVVGALPEVDCRRSQDIPALSTPRKRNGSENNSNEGMQRRVSKWFYRVIEGFVARTGTKARFRWVPF